MNKVDLTDRQRRELISLAGYPQISLDDAAACELEHLGLVELVSWEVGKTPRWRFTPAGREALPPEQHARLAETEAMEEARVRAFEKLGLKP